MRVVLAWLHEEPVRVYLYTVAAATLALLVALGVVSGSLVPVIIGVLTSVLSVPGVESLRSRVTPVSPDSDGS